MLVAFLSLCHETYQRGITNFSPLAVQRDVHVPHLQGGQSGGGEEQG